LPSKAFLATSFLSFSSSTQTTLSKPSGNEQHTTQEIARDEKITTPSYDHGCQGVCCLVDFNRCTQQVFIIAKSFQVHVTDLIGVSAAVVAIIRGV
jgi:hypothetical protein